MATKLTKEQLEDAARLKRIYEARKAEDKSISQEWLAAECGWKTQSAVTQYLNGAVPLNLEALIKFSLALKASVSDISPSLSAKILSARLGPSLPSAPAISAEARAVAEAFDRLQSDAQKKAVITQLQAFGTLQPPAKS